VEQGEWPPWAAYRWRNWDLGGGGNVHLIVTRCFSLAGVFVITLSAGLYLFWEFDGHHDEELLFPLFFTFLSMSVCFCPAFFVLHGVLLSLLFFRTWSDSLVLFYVCYFFIYLFFALLLLFLPCVCFSLVVLFYGTHQLPVEASGLVGWHGVCGVLFVLVIFFTLWYE
jgi:hypothetical protein